MPEHQPVVRTLGFLTAVAIAAFALWTYYFHPALFRHVTWEDNLVEYLSALCFLAAAVLWGTGGVKALRVPRRRGLAFLCFAAGLAMLVACLEEISWAQRLAEIESPAFFERYNEQKELNLHNIGLTWLHPEAEVGSVHFNALVYGAFFVVGVVAFGALVVVAGVLGDRLKAVATFVPSYEEVLIFALATPFMSSSYLRLIPVNDLYVLGSAVVILVLVLLHRRNLVPLGRSFAGDALIVVLLIVLAAVVFQFIPRRLVTNRPNEVRELLLGLGCFSYAARVRSRLAGEKPSS